MNRDYCGPTVTAREFSQVRTVWAFITPPSYTVLYLYPFLKQQFWEVNATLQGFYFRRITKILVQQVLGFFKKNTSWRWLISLKKSIEIFIFKIRSIAGFRGVGRLLGPAPTTIS